MAKSAKHISEPGDLVPYQSRLAETPGFVTPSVSPFPDVSGDPAVLEAILATGGLKGNDWEFKTEPGPRHLEPTVCAVSSGDLIYSAPWTPAFKERLGRAFREGVAPDGVRYSWAAHSYAGADKAVADKAFGFESKLDDWECSMVSHFLVNQCLCKASEKDEDDPGSLGFMDLGTMASLVTDLPRYKKCRGSVCPGPDPDRPMYSRVHPCPSHSVCSYCGIDAWLSPKGHEHNMKILERMGMGLWFYRDMMELSEECYLMEKQGIKVNLEHIIRTNEILEQKKAQLFPFTGKGKKQVFKDFNPQSAKQIIAWFKERGINLKKTDKETVKEALDVLADKEGVEGGASGLDDHDEPLSYTLQKLWDLFIYKSEGKGLDPWFHEKYFPDTYHRALKRAGFASIYEAKVYDPVFGIKEYDAFYKLVSELDQYAYIHPRFVQTGTSSGRWSSSRPNSTNLPKRGFGELVRKGIVARSKDKDITKADFAQLELRFVLWCAGTPYKSSDAFRWLVNETGTSFHEAARIAKPKEFAKDPADAARNIAKVVSHACVTGDHEVLTPTGWVRIDEWENQPIAEWDRGTAAVSFKIPKAYHKYEDSEVFHVTGKNVAFDQMVTGNHRIPAVNKVSNNGKWYWRDLTPDTWDQVKTSQLPVSGFLDGPELYSDMDLRRAIAIQADGSKVQRSPGGWRFHIKKLRKIERLEYLFGERPKETNYGTFKLPVKFTSPLLTEDKKLTWEFITGTSLRQKLLCLDEFFNWDGSRLKTSQVYNNSCKQSLDIFQALAHLAGKQSKINREYGKGGYADKAANPKDVYRASLNRRRYAAKERTFVTPVEGKHSVYCFTTESGYFLVRRNKHVSVTGNSNYMQGFILIEPYSLNDKRTRQLIEAGALRVYSREFYPQLDRDWTFRGKLVAFTGSNLASTLYKDKSVASRKKALDIQENIYFARFFSIREWQMRVLRDAEKNGYVQSPSGRFLRLYGMPEEEAKIAIAFIGQGGGSDHVQGIQLRLKREQDRIPIMVVHDEIVIETFRSMSDEEVVNDLKIMEQETRRFPGFVCPVEIKRWHNWNDKNMRTIYKG